MRGWVAFVSDYSLSSYLVCVMQTGDSLVANQHIAATPLKSLDYAVPKYETHYNQMEADVLA